MNANTTTIQVTLKGIRPIMFDRFFSMEKGQELTVEQKFYLEGDKIVLPALNVMSFLSADLTESATKRVMGRAWKKTAKAALSFVDVNPFNIPFKKDGEDMTLANSAWYMLEHTARVKKSGGLIIPSPKKRPVLPLPWSLDFELQLRQNNDLTDSTLKNIFERGGLEIGFGTFRGVFGKFVVEKWEVGTA